MKSNKFGQDYKILWCAYKDWDLEEKQQRVILWRKTTKDVEVVHSTSNGTNKQCLRTEGCKLGVMQDADCLERVGKKASLI